MTRILHAPGVDPGTIASSVPRPYAENKDALDTAAELDKDDIFDHPFLADDDYRRRVYSNGVVGIEYDRRIHTANSPIFEHQREAVRLFLSRFRCVGILADEVGMGKTVEAGMVLSELAERKCITSLLVVAQNLENWESTLRNQFGITGLTRVRTSDEIRSRCVGVGRGIAPEVPMMMTMDDFCALSLQGLDEVCFDAVVIDEVHNFSLLGDYARGMYVLSHFMEIKNRKAKPYCILVSGTPHNGTLDSMFDLWYFITRRGNVGDARVFDPDRAARDNKCLQLAREHYHNYLCNGSNTIAEFVESFKIEKLRQNTDFAAFVAANTEPGPERAGSYWTIGNYALRNQFLRLDENRALAAEIQKTTLTAYNNLLYSFMIRQSRRKLGKQNTKRSYNYYFCPVDENAARLLPVTVKESDLRTDPEKNKAITVGIRIDRLDSDEAVDYKGTSMSLDGFANALHDADRLRALNHTELSIRRTRAGTKTDLVFGALNYIRAFESFVPGEGGTVGNFGSEARKYYHNSFTAYSDALIENTVKAYSGDLFERKAELFADLLSGKLSGEKVIVFFDYYSQSADVKSEPRRLYDWLRKNRPEVFGRIVSAFDPRYADSDAVADAFIGARLENPVLFASETLSESYNLQYASHTVVNFSVCHSPIKMDQRIGRVDRIGQSENMEVYSFASMDALDGFILAFFNRIRLFSGWRDDIILVTGCDNENAKIMRCRNCERIMLVLDESHVCASCNSAGTLYEIKNATSFRCNNNECSFLLERRGLDNDYAYVCQQPEPKLRLDSVSVADKNGVEREVYQCDKRCVIMHCPRLTAENCEAKRLALTPAGADINKIRRICSICKKSRQNVCPHCFETNADFCISRCGSAACRLRVHAVAGADCPECKTHFRKGKLVALSPVTFDAFAAHIWNLPGFVKNFEFETDKIQGILETLRSNDDGGAR